MTAKMLMDEAVIERQSPDGSTELRLHIRLGKLAEHLMAALEPPYRAMTIAATQPVRQSAEGIIVSVSASERPGSDPQPAADALLEIDRDLPEHLVLCTDGSCLGNPGKGSWGVVVTDTEGHVLDRRSGSARRMTNNQMELVAIAEGLELIAGRCGRITVRSDSQYACKAFNEGWLKNSHRNGWRTASRQPVKNQDLWARTDAPDASGFCQPWDCRLPSAAASTTACRNITTASRTPNGRSGRLICWRSSPKPPGRQTTICAATARRYPKPNG